MRISDWSSDVCSSDLDRHRHLALGERGAVEQGDLIVIELAERAYSAGVQIGIVTGLGSRCEGAGPCRCGGEGGCPHQRSEEHTSELQSLMRISYAVFCLKKTKIGNNSIKLQRRNDGDV